jgi:beta-glucosidase
MTKNFFRTSILITSFAFVQQANAQFDTTAKINALIKQMTLEEKVNMIHASSSFTSGGVKRLAFLS